MTSARTAAIYVRISDDKAAEAAGVARQERDCRELADRFGWTVGEVYTENDTSAFKRRKVRLPDGTTAMRVVRPAFRRLLDDLASGAADAVIGYDLDRVARDPRDLEDLIDVVENRGVPTRAVTGSLDLSTDAGITMARVMVAVANKSSRDTSRRVARKHLELAETGRHGGGGIRAFGYGRDGVTLDEWEAATIREIADRIIGGESLTSVARWLNERGVPTVRGGAWSSRSVHAVVTKARNAGLREHHGEVVGPAVWPAIIDRDTWERVRLTLDARAHGATNAFRHWLAGTLVCGREGCGRNLSAAPTTGGSHRYWCSTPKGGCGRIAIDGPHAEAAVSALITGYLSRPDVTADLQAATSSEAVERARTDMQADEAQLRELAALWAARQITTGEYMTARRSIEERVGVANTIVRAALPGAVRDLLTADDIETRWESFTAAQKREVARVIFPSCIRVDPRAEGGMRVFSPERLVPLDWR